MCKDSRRDVLVPGARVGGYNDNNDDSVINDNDDNNVIIDNDDDNNNNDNDDNNNNNDRCEGWWFSSFHELLVLETVLR